MHTLFQRKGSCLHAKLAPSSQAWKLDLKACVGEWSDKKLLIQFSMYYLLSTKLSKWYHLGG